MFAEHRHGEVRIAAVVLNYRTPELVVRCLETLLPEIEPAQDVVVVVDNASGDGSVEKIRAAANERGWRSVRVVESERNGGFASGNNVGIRAVEARAYLLLNSDTLLRPGAVAQLWSALCARPRAGLLGPRLEWEDGRAQVSSFRFPTPWSEFISGSATEPLRRLLDRWDVPLPVEDEPSSPDWISFAAVLIRNEVLRNVGPLDEGFFMYFEDADYCRRARRAGWEVWQEPAARIVHLRGRTSPVKLLAVARKRRPRYYYAARSRYFRNAWGSAGLLLANLGFTAGWAVARLRETVGNKQPHTVERQLADTWRG